MPSKIHEYRPAELNLPKESNSFIVPSLIVREEEEVENTFSEATFHVENVMVFEGTQKPEFGNKEIKELRERSKDERVIQIQRYLFGTDMWFTGLGMTIQQLCDPKDQVIKEGELYRYKPGINTVYNMVSLRLLHWSFKRIGSVCIQ